MPKENGLPPLHPGEIKVSGWLKTVSPVRGSLVGKAFDAIDDDGADRQLPAPELESDLANCVKNRWTRRRVNAPPVQLLRSPRELEIGVAA